MATEEYAEKMTKIKELAIVKAKQLGFEKVKVSQISFDPENNYGKATISYKKNKVSYERQLTCIFNGDEIMINIQ